MDIKDLVVTPIFLFLLTFLFFKLKPILTNADTEKFYFSALFLRFFGALFLGVIYQFYYGGGDTFNFFYQGTVLYETLIENPRVGLRMMFGSNVYSAENFEYASNIYWYRFSSEYFIIRMSAFIGFFSGNTYSTIALFFASLSFLGSWLTFSVIQSKFPQNTLFVALGVLFVPSIFFWGSGVLKDTVTLGALGVSFWCLFQIIENSKVNVRVILLLLVSMWLIQIVKIYILLTFIPAVVYWAIMKSVGKVKNVVIRFLVAPLIFVSFIVAGYSILKFSVQDSSRYKFDALAESAYITSYDIRYGTGKNAGSGYDIGFQDGSWGNLIKLAPQAINVALFRPYLWEVNNPLMLLSAIESSIVVIFTLWAIFSLRYGINRALIKQPMIQMFILFSLTFAFAVGVSTYNFGSLSRYKIPLIPFYVTTILLLSSSKKDT